jgi:hypothetical protein
MQYYRKSGGRNDHRKQIFLEYQTTVDSHFPGGIGSARDTYVRGASHGWT